MTFRIGMRVYILHVYRYLRDKCIRVASDNARVCTWETRCTLMRAEIFAHVCNLASIRIKMIFDPTLLYNPILLVNYEASLLYLISISMIKSKKKPLMTISFRIYFYLLHKKNNFVEISTNLVRYRFKRKSKKIIYVKIRICKNL